MFNGCNQFILREDMSAVQIVSQFYIFQFSIFFVFQGFINHGLKRINNSSSLNKGNRSSVWINNIFDFYNFISSFSPYNLVSNKICIKTVFEYIYKNVPKILCCTSYFQLSSWWLEMCSYFAFRTVLDKVNLKDGQLEK